MTQIDVART